MSWGMISRQTQGHFFPLPPSLPPSLSKRSLRPGAGAVQKPYPPPPSLLCPISPLNRSRHFCQDTEAWPGSQQAPVMAPCQAESGLASPVGSRTGASCPQWCSAAAHERPIPRGCAGLTVGSPELQQGSSHALNLSGFSHNPQLSVHAVQNPLSH